LGQYYLGSLRHIGLIEEPVDQKGIPLGIYRITQKKKDVKISGEDLASAFEVNLDPKHKKLYLQCIENGSVNIKQLETLTADFNLSELPDDNTETEFLVTLLLDIDKPTGNLEDPVSMRKETLVHLLKFANNDSKSFGVRSFTKFAYANKGLYENDIDLCLTGWYYYQFNEYWQVACTAIFNGCLDFLHEKVVHGWMLLPELVEDCTNEIVKSLANKEIIKDKTTLVKFIVNSDQGTEDNCYKSIHENRKIERMVYGFLLIWKLFNENKSNLDLLRDYTNARSIGDNEDVLTFYMGFEKYENQKIGHFISDFLLNRILMRHQYVAYRKMGSGVQSTQKFIIENNHIRQIDNYGPVYTSPRIANLIEFMHDLKLLTHSNKVAAMGKAILKKHN